MSEGTVSNKIFSPSASQLVGTAIVHGTCCKPKPHINGTVCNTRNSALTTDIVFFLSWGFKLRIGDLRKFMVSFSRNSSCEGRQHQCSNLGPTLGHPLACHFSAYAGIPCPSVSLTPSSTLGGCRTMSSAPATQHGVQARRHFVGTVVLAAGCYIAYWCLTRNVNN